MVKNKPEIVSKPLKHVFSDEERLELGDRLGRAFGKVDEQESRKTEVTAQLNADLKAVQAEARSIAVKLQNGYEIRDFDCEVVRDFAANIVRHVRQDTGEVVSERAMEAHERQKALDLEDGAVLDEVSDLAQDEEAAATGNEGLKPEAIPGDPPLAGALGDLAEELGKDGVKFEASLERGEISESVFPDIQEEDGSIKKELLEKEKPGPMDEAIEATKGDDPLADLETDPPPELADPDEPAAGGLDFDK